MVNKIFDCLAKVVFIKISTCIIYVVTCLCADDCGSFVFEILGFSLFWPLQTSEFLFFSVMENATPDINLNSSFFHVSPDVFFLVILILHFRTLEFLATRPLHLQIST